MAWVANFKDGERRVVLKPSSLAPVAVINVTRRNTKPELITSYQHANACKDILVTTIRNNGKVELQAERVSVRSGAARLTDEDQVRIISSLPEELKLWLLDVDKQKFNHILPAGFGWDGVFSESEHNKRQSIRDAILAGNYWHDLDNEWFAKLLDEATKTRKEHLSLDWANALPMTPYINDSPLFDDTTVEIITISNGVHKLHKRKRVIGNAVNYHGFKVDSSIDKVIVIKYGVMIDEDATPFGCDIKIYANEANDTTGSP